VGVSQVLVIAGSGHTDYGLGVPHRVNQMYAFHAADTIYSPPMSTPVVVA
jgi:uncharacterized iron-regulated protein